MKTTFAKIKSHNPCSDGWKKLISYYNPRPLDKEVTIEEIVKSNGIKDAVWAIIAVDDQCSVQLFMADVAEMVLPIYEKQYPNDSRVSDCIDGRRKFANNEITKEEWKVLRSAAYTAAAYAAYAAAAVYDAYDYTAAAADAWANIENLLAKYY